MHGAVLTKEYTETSIEYLQYTKFSENLERLLSSVCSAPGSLQLSPSTLWLRCHKLICLFTSFWSPPSHFPPSPPPPTRCRSSWATNLMSHFPDPGPSCGQSRQAPQSSKTSASSCPRPAWSVHPPFSRLDVVHIISWMDPYIARVCVPNFPKTKKTKQKLDPVGSTVRYEMMKLCTGSV